MHNLNLNSITHDQISAFVLNELKGKQREKIVKAINTNEIIREMYLCEKRQYDVERYLDNEMSIEEYCEFEDLLTKKPSLNEYFVLSKDINDFLHVEALRNQFEKIHYELYGMGCNHELDENDEGLYSLDQIKKHDKVIEGHRLGKDTVSVKKLKHEIFKIGKWLSAASIVFIIGFSAVHMYLNNRGSVENRLYKKYYELFQNNTKNYFNSSAILKVKNLYSQYESGDALFILQNMPSSLDLEPEKKLYSGLALMELERYTEAIERFKTLQNDDEMTVLSISQWYLALCYLATEKRYEAVTILEEIVENKSYNYDKATKILKKLLN